MNNSKLYRLILSGLKKNYKKSIRDCNKPLMEFVKLSLISIRNSGNSNFCRKVERYLKMTDFFLQTYQWNRKSKKF